MWFLSRCVSIRTAERPSRSLRFPLTSVAISQNLFLPLDGIGRKRKGIYFGIWQYWWWGIEGKKTENENYNSCFQSKHCVKQSWGERALSATQSGKRIRSNWKMVSESVREDILSGSSMTATPSSGQYFKLIGWRNISKSILSLRRDFKTLADFERLCKEKIKDGNNSNAMLMLVLLEKGMSFKVS